MRKKYLFLIITPLLLISCNILRTSHPLQKLNFKDHNWQIVYVEDKSSNAGKFVQNVWLLNSSETIDSLKKEYTCELNRQGDGDPEYQIYLFKDNKYYTRNIYNDQKKFSLGKIKPKLVPVQTSYINCPNWYSTKNLIDSLTKEKISFTITPKEVLNKSINECSIMLDLCTNTSSKLFQNGDTLLNDWTPNAQKELTRLFPELTLEDVSSGYSNDSGMPSAPGNLNDSSRNSFQHIALRFVFSKDGRPFKLDISRLKNTDLFSCYYINELYTVTIYRKSTLTNTR
jgi:hypothetical protein